MALQDMVNKLVDKLDETGAEEAPYASPQLSDVDRDDVRAKVKAFVEAVATQDTEVARARLQKITKHLALAVNLAVSAVMADLPPGVTRVDGTIVEPLLKDLVKKGLEKLPPPVVEEPLP